MDSDPNMRCAGSNTGCAKVIKSVKTTNFILFLPMLTVTFYNFWRFAKAGLDEDNAVCQR